MNKKKTNKIPSYVEAHHAHMIAGWLLLLRRCNMDLFLLVATFCISLEPGIDLWCTLTVFKWFTMEKLCVDERALRVWDIVYQACKTIVSLILIAGAYLSWLYRGIPFELFPSSCCCVFFSSSLPHSQCAIERKKRKLWRETTRKAV